MAETIRILLINPSFKHSHKFLSVNEPLGLAYIAAYLRQHNYDVEIIDAVAEGGINREGRYWRYGLGEKELFKRIVNSRADIVGVTCLFSRLKNDALDVIRLVKKVNKKIITVAGGAHFSIFPEETLLDENVDFVIIGEGEESFLKLIKQIELKNSDFEIDGCAYRALGTVKLIPKKHFIGNLDDLPMPARDLLAMDFYFKNDNAVFGIGKKRNALIVTSRSCPNTCSFCAIHLIQGRGFRPRSAENVLEEIKYLVDKYQINELSVMDDNFTLDKKRVMDICELISKNNLKIRWNTPNGVHINNLDREVLIAMKKAGCINIGIGIESGDENTRSKIIGKHILTDKIIEVANICREINLPAIGFFVIGFPRENSISFLNTIKLIKKLPLEMISVCFATPYPGTELYEECFSGGYIKKNDYDVLLNSGALNYDAPFVETTDFNKELLYKTRRKMYIEFFLSHFQQIFWKTVLLKNDFLTIKQMSRFFMENFL